MRHGRSAYVTGKCRCKICTDANNTQQRKTRAKMLAKFEATGELPDGIEHGTASAYGNWGCRCDDCFDYKRSENRRNVERRKAWRAHNAEIIRRLGLG